MNPATESAVEERDVELVIREAVGVESPPDIAERVVALARKRFAAARRGPSRWASVACALLGVGAVVLIAQWRETPSTPSGTTGDDEPVEVRSIQDARGLAPDTEKIRLRAYSSDILWSLSRLKKVRVLDASFDLVIGWRPHEQQRPGFFPAAAEPLGLMTGIEQLDLSGHRVEGLDALATLASLRQLRMANCLIVPESLRVLPRLHRLRDLSLVGSLSVDPDTPILDLCDPEEGLAAIMALRDLERLSLSAVSVSEAGLRALASHRGITDLRLSYLYGPRKAGEDRPGHIVADDYLVLRSMTQLRRLELTSTDVDHAVLEPFEDFPFLHTLNLCGSGGLGAAEVGRALAKIPALQNLDVSGTDFDVPTARELSKSPSLKQIYFDLENPASDQVCTLLAEIESLRSIRVASMAGKDEHLACFDATKLEEVSVAYADLISAAGVAQLPPTVKSLTVLPNQVNGSVYDALPELRRLTILGTDQKPRVLVELLEHELRSHLEYLQLSGGSIEELERVAELPALRELDLSQCRAAIDPELVEALENRGIQVNLPRPRPKVAPTGAPVIRVR